MNRTARIAIVGGGLAGLVAGNLLQQAGMDDFVILEARQRAGGRVLGTGLQSDEGFDLGATWFWPEWQPALAELVAGLGLNPVLQDERGDMLVERYPHQAPVRMPGMMTAPPSFRLGGGMSGLVDALVRRLAPGRLVTGARARQLCLGADGVDIMMDGDSSCRADRVLLALPPRLAAGLQYQPVLPAGLHSDWLQTETWMAAHAKYVAIYPEPFWRSAGLSGFVSSRIGPLGEIHDLSSRTGQAALFGFFGMSAPERARVPEQQLRAQCRDQMVRLFGAAAANPLFDIIKDWSQDPLTATAADQLASGQHPNPPASSPLAGLWQGRLAGIASEWSTQFPGYLAGAIDAAQRGVVSWLTDLV